MRPFDETAIPATSLDDHIHLKASESNTCRPFVVLKMNSFERRAIDSGGTLLGVCEQSAHTQQRQKREEHVGRHSVRSRLVRHRQRGGRSNSYMAPSMHKSGAQPGCMS